MNSNAVLNVSKYFADQDSVVSLLTLLQRVHCISYYITLHCSSVAVRSSTLECSSALVIV